MHRIYKENAPDGSVEIVRRTFEFGKGKSRKRRVRPVCAADATTQEIMAAIFEENKASYFGNIRLDLLDTFADLGVPEVISTAYGRMRVVREQVDCDYFDFLDGKGAAFRGEYMSQYSFAEETCGRLNERHKAKKQKNFL